MIQRSMTADEFAASRADLPDAGQWAELIRGVPVVLSPPDLDHGTIVLNLSKAFSAYIHETETGYACFDLGLRVERRPDTVLFPACSYFLDGPRFAEADKEFTDVVPALVVELLTTGDRRRQTSERLSAYLAWGVPRIWLIDPQQRAAFVAAPLLPQAHRLSESELLRGAPQLPGFEMRVADLFEEPEWAR